MTKGPRRLVLDRYLDSAAEGSLKGAGRDWKNKADDLHALGEALQKAAQQAELRIGEQTLTGPALRASMEASSTAMTTKAAQLRAAAEALTQVGQQIADTREARDSLADLGTKPSPYQAPAGTPGVEPTPEELQAQADASHARQAARTTWQSQYDQQEATSLALTKEMDSAFLAAIPPMKEIHGQQDPTEPPPNVPSGPGGTYLPGTQAPPITGGGGGGGGDTPTTGLVGDNGGRDVGTDGGKDGGKDKPPPTVITTTTTETPTTTPTTTTHPTTTHPAPGTSGGPTTTVSGSSQNGVTYQPGGPSVSAPGGSAGGTSAGTSAAALGAAGGAGGLAAGAIRPGSMPGAATRGSAPVRSIGSTGRTGSPGALSRSSGSSAAGRGASTGSSAGRGGAGSRGASGSSTGSRSGSRGSSGARTGAGGTGGGRGGRKGERESTNDRDSLVYDQDWLGDDDVAPGVLD